MFPVILPPSNMCRIWTVSYDSVSSTVSRSRSYVRGPYNKKKDSSDISKQSENELSGFEDKIKRPRRGPNTRKVMHRDYPTFWKSLPGPEVEDEPPPLSGLSPVREILSADCYTCGFSLDRNITEGGDKVVRCKECNEGDIHQSCLRACRRCEELE